MWKSATSSGAPFSAELTSSSEPPNATPSALLICCMTAAIEVAWLVSAASISENVRAFTPVKKKERMKPETSSGAMMQTHGVVGSKRPLTAVRTDAVADARQEHRAEAADAEDAARDELGAEGADRRRRR